uniref:Uncharacterized protein n=1 Tax=Leersia perrieri TaxID=77586 RepID=A0A0D9WRL8_9ORYZ
MAVTGGIEPLKLLYWRKMTVSEEVLSRASGSSPLRMLWSSQSFGIAPVRAFHPRSTIVSERLLPRDGGILPERLLLARRSLRSSGRFPKAEGMLPWSLLLPSCEHEESSDGMLPSREFMLRLRLLS